MPTYGYRCEKGHAFEVFQRMSDEPVKTCEVCGKPVQRVMHPVAVHFKGKGFYNTDYGTKKRQRELAQAGDGSSKDSKSSSEKSDSGGSDSGGSDSAKSDSSSSTDSGSGSTTSEKTDSKPKPDAKSSKQAKPAA